MVTKEQAEEYLRTKLARNLTICDSWETDNHYIFALAYIDEYDRVRPLFGDSTVKVDKEVCEIVWGTGEQ